MRMERMGGAKSATEVWKLEYSDEGPLRGMELKIHSLLQPLHSLRCH